MPFEVIVWKSLHVCASARGLTGVSASPKISVTSSLPFFLFCALRTSLMKGKGAQGMSLESQFSHSLCIWKRTQECQISIWGWRWKHRLTTDFWSVLNTKSSSNIFWSDLAQKFLAPSFYISVRCFFSPHIRLWTVHPAVFNACWKWKEALDFSASPAAICWGCRPARFKSV